MGTRGWEKMIYPGRTEIWRWTRCYDSRRSGFNEMENWKACGIYAQDVQTTGEILGRAGEFVVVAHPDDKVWLERRVLEDPRFAAREVGSYRDWRIRIWRFGW